MAIIMQWIITSLWNAFGKVLGLLGAAIMLPFRSGSGSKTQSIARWGLHFVCIAVILAGLAFLNYSLQIDRLLQTPLSGLRHAWLPTLFILTYFMSWIVWWVYRVANTANPLEDFHELRNEWNRTLRQLSETGINIQKTPIFLTLGTPEGGMRQFFDVAKIENLLPQTREVEQGPFQVIANREAIYVCCGEASLFSEQSKRIHSAVNARKGVARSSSKSYQSQPGDVPNDAPDLRPNDCALAGWGFSANNLDFDNQEVNSVANPHSIRSQVASDPIDANVACSEQTVADTASFEQNLSTTVALKSNGLQTNYSQNQVTPSAINAYASLSLVESNIAILDASDESTRNSPTVKPTRYQPAIKPSIPLLHSDSEISEIESALVNLCSLIEEARAPQCAVNGVLVIIPFDATTDQKTANHCGMLIERDLETIQSSTLLSLPRLAVFSDLQNVPGSTQLLSGFPDQQKDRRLGIQLPWLPDCDAAKTASTVNDGIRWVFQTMLPPLINRLFHTESGPESVTTTRARNEHLYQFMSSIGKRTGIAQRLIQRGFLNNTINAQQLRGCYLTANGRDANSQRGFANGVIGQLLEMQNEVQWKPDAIHFDRERRRWARLGYFAIGGLGTATLLLLII